MKKITLIIGLLGCYAASAQESDFFNDQLKLRRQKEKQPYTYQLPAPQDNPAIAPPALFQHEPGVIAPGRFLLQLPNGNKVYALSQDNMPCIVPEMNRQVMPNGAG
ncbi:MAG: hypothetical protein ABW019_18165, partial [Chitinophagaceae bacterium]